MYKNKNYVLWKKGKRYITHSSGIVLYFHYDPNSINGHFQKLEFIEVFHSPIVKLWHNLICLIYISKH